MGVSFHWKVNEKEEEKRMDVKENLKLSFSFLKLLNSPKYKSKRHPIHQQEHHHGPHTKVEVLKKSVGDEWAPRFTYPPQPTPTASDNN